MTVVSVFLEEDEVGVSVAVDVAVDWFLSLVPGTWPLSVECAVCEVCGCCPSSGDCCLHGLNQKAMRAWMKDLPLSNALSAASNASRSFDIL